MVYVVVTVGLTSTVKLVPDPLNEIDPGDSVPVNVPVPAPGVIVNVADCPLHIVVDPLNVATGRGLVVQLTVFSEDGEQPGPVAVR